MRIASRTSLAATLVALGLGGVLLAGGLPKLPSDHAFPKGAESPGVVTFSHGSHVDEKKPSCTACHPGLFKMLRENATGLKLQHEQMEKGQQCGACHDGKAAHGMDDCAACHRDQ